MGNSLSIIESVDSTSRDGPDTPICAIHYKMRINSDLVTFLRLVSHIIIHDLRQISYPASQRMDEETIVEVQTRGVKKWQISFSIVPCNSTLPQLLTLVYV